MKDRISLYPGRVKIEPVAGQANLYDLTRADQPTQEGTPLNKANLLKDATAALFGKTNAAVPDDILNLLSKSVIAQGTKITDVLGNLISIPADQVKDGVKIATGSYTGTGTYGNDNTNSLTFEFEPKIIMITRNTTEPANPPLWGFLFPHFTRDYDISGASYYQNRENVSLYYIRAWVQDGGTTVKWYSLNADRQLNKSGREFTYFAIG